MLVLSRNKDQAIVASFGGLELVVTILDIKGGRVRIGLEAPQEITIAREECIDKQSDKVPQ